MVFGVGRPRGRVGPIRRVCVPPERVVIEPARLLESIGIDVEKFYDYFDQDFWDREGLSKSILFGSESFGDTKLVPGYGSRDWDEFAADMPMV